MNQVKLKYVIIGIVAILLIVGLVDKFSSPVKKININGQEYKIEVVSTPAKLSKGLSDRENIAENEAMLFLFGDKDFRSFWMKDMNFPIDLLWIDGNLIVGWEENMDPQIGDPETSLKKYRSLQPVDKVLELPAGAIKKLDIKRGQNINL